MDAVLEADTKKFNAALAKCGVDEAGDEPVRALYYRFMADLPPSVLAAEMGGLGDDSTAILAILQKHPSREVNEITGKFEAGQPVPRSIFLQVFPKLVADLGMPGVQVFAELAVTEFGGKVIDDNLNGGNKNGGGIRRLDAKQETVRVIDLNIGGAGGGKAVGMTLQGQQPASASDAATTKGGVIRINLADGTSSSDPGPAPAIRNATGTDGQDGGQKVFKLALPKNGDGYDQSQISAAAQESQHHGR